MTTELWYLFLTAILLTILWIPFIIQQAIAKGPLSPDEYVNLRDDTKFSAAIRRANRAHINLVEQFGAFVALVVVAHLIGLSNGVTQTSVIVYFWARVAHALVMLIGFKHLMARTLIFTVSFFSLLVLAWQIFAASM